MILDQFKITPELRRILGCNNQITIEAIVALLFEGNGRSVLKGAATELLFLQDVERQGALFCRRASDLDRNERFDYEVVFENMMAVSFEVKKPYEGKANVDFRDARNVLLPSGKTWKTHARHKDEKFDLLACPVIEEGKVYYVRFEHIPFINPVGRKFYHWRQKDRDYVRENYLQPRVSLEYATTYVPIS